MKWTWSTKKILKYTDKCLTEGILPINCQRPWDVVRLTKGGSEGSEEAGPGNRGRWRGGGEAHVQEAVNNPTVRKQDTSKPHSYNYPDVEKTTDLRINPEHIIPDGADCVHWTGNSILRDLLFWSLKISLTVHKIETIHFILLTLPKEQWISKIQQWN